MATESRPATPRAKIDVRALVVLASIAVAVYLSDQVSKYLVVENLELGRPVQILGEALEFVYVKNPGAAFSLASGSTWIFSIAASVVTVIIVVLARRIRSTSWAVLFGMLLGGTVGNLTDRLVREPSIGLGHVVDFIQVAYFPAVFNIADIFIVSSMGLFIILTVRGTGLDGVRESERASDAAAENSVDGTAGSAPLDDPTVR
ncbi:signal peptidase II [Marisediminicola sp. LYQ85]|uniref:signal peptidase II n=1 Tax=Marisediminicola sp. LYQ85 TaxID=3391062 RepID=UPI0039833F06